MLTRRLLVAASVLAVIVIGLGAQAPASRNPAVPVPAQSSRAMFESAGEAWDRGDYVTAVTGYQALLARPDADAWLEPIALQTGELFKTVELTADGQNPRFSPDGRWVAYETGSGAARKTRVVDTADGAKPAAEWTGFSTAFSPAADRVVYLRPAATGELTKALADAAQAAASGAGQGGPPSPPASSGQGGRGGASQAAFLQAKYVDIVVRTLASGSERVCPTDGLLKMAPVFGVDGQTIYFLGAREADASRNDIYAMPAGCGEPKVVSGEGGYKQNLQVVPGSAALLVYTPTAANPFPRPATPGGPPSAGATAPSTGSGQGGRGGATSFSLLNPASGATSTTAGMSLAISADGTTWAYLVRTGEDTALMAGPVGGAAKAIKQTRDRMASPAVSPDGSRIAVQVMPKDDWEIFVYNRGGSNELRVTREIQHDTLPRFVTNTLLLAATGEPRHMRSSLYDLAAAGAAQGLPAQTRLFHNNTIRTIAPEYTWAASADGRRILVTAERDGDTVSPERGIYLVPLDRKVAKADIAARLAAQRAAEKTLRADGQRMFAPIAAAVKQALAEVSITRIYNYEKTLFDFDSKHISKPGNKPAGDYLFEMYRSFGYAPEYQWFEPRGALGGKSANIIATLKGTENPDLIYVVSSHYDSNVVSPGADDDSSATAALLEAARVLAGRPMPATIIFASFTGEEAGLLGSREFVRRAQAAGWKIVGALNNDMIGWANDHRLDNTIRYSNPGIRDVQHAASFLTRLITYDSLYFKSTDAAAYYDAYGDIVGGIGSYPVLGNPHYHQPTDLLETVNHEQVAETSKVTAASVMLLASSPSRLAGLAVKTYRNRTATISWTPSPEKGVRSYIVAYGPAASPLKARVTALTPEVTLPGIDPGTVVSVKAVNARGLEGWDWARTVVR